MPSKRVSAGTGDSHRRRRYTSVRPRSLAMQWIGVGGLGPRHARFVGPNPRQRLGEGSSRKCDERRRRYSLKVAMDHGASPLTGTSVRATLLFAGSLAEGIAVLRCRSCEWRQRRRPGELMCQETEKGAEEDPAFGGGAVQQWEGQQRPVAACPDGTQQSEGGTGLAIVPRSGSNGRDGRAYELGLPGYLGN